MKIKYFNRTQLSPKIEARYDASYCSTLQELLGASDVVSINCPFNKDTEGLIGKSEFQAMKDGTFFINTARGPIVQEEALKEALLSGKVLRAGLDVFADEPNVDPWFLESDACVVQPHMGGLTDAAFHGESTRRAPSRRYLWSPTISKALYPIPTRSQAEVYSEVDFLT
jgi:lactate dehydrogenase-like 2-hydroxyacid dehydrogenase